MSSNSKALHAVLVLPRGLQRAVDDVDLRRWLSRGRLQEQDGPVEPLHRALAEIGHAVPGDGLASLRLWGQTGERPSTWMMAADPVHLQTLIDHLRLHSLAGELQLADLRPLFDSLQAQIGSPDCAFARVGGCGYVRAEHAIASSRFSPEVVDSHPPDEFMPAGAGSESYHRLLSEVQMFLHDHPVNESRARLGLPAINSLWFWGGGTAPASESRPIFPLFALDPLFQGYWLCCDGRVESRVDDLAAMAESASDGFVAVLPTGSDRQALRSRLLQLRYLMKRNQVRRATLLFAEGLKIDLRRSDRMKFMRSVSPLLEPQ